MKILIAPILQGKPWNGATIYSDSLGGSESAVAFMAKALVRKGAQVTVMASGPGGVYDGVTYVTQNEFAYLVAAQWDVMIASRWIEILEQPWQARMRVLWVHDLPQHGTQIFANRVITVSAYQAAMWALPPEVVLISRNGYDPDLYTIQPNRLRDLNKLVWASNPDRGLPIAARIFQQLRERWPELELHVYGRSSIYGWSDAEETKFLPREDHMTNVFLHPSLPRGRLAVEFAKAWALFYPTYWPETSCMTAIEAQALGLPVVSAPVGALPETVKGGILTYDYLNAISQLRNHARWRALSEAGQAHVREYYQWDVIADEWLTDFDVFLRGQGVPDNGAVPGSSVRAEDLVPEVVGADGSAEGEAA